jgi:hypothetical protein
MTSILYGNLCVEILDDLGARLDRLSVRGRPSLIRRPFRPQEKSTVPLLGRDEPISEAYAAVGSQGSIEFTATCGYGKSALLRHIATNAVYDGLARSSVYLLAGSDGLHDLLQRIVAELFTSDPPVKPTPEQCAELLGQVRAMIVLDDVMLDPGQIDYLLRVLPGCSLLLGTLRPVLGRHGTSRILAGLPSHAAVELITSELGRQLTGGELAAVEHLAVAVDGQPLHLRQAAALVREDGLSFEWLARIAERDPGQLDRLSVSVLAGQGRRALAVLALAAGALLPADLVGAMGDIAQIGQSLGLLHRRGLAEQHANRFGLPVCKVAGYRQMLLKDLQLAAALREFASWLANRDPTTADSLSAARAALGIIEWAAELGDWPAVVRLVRVAEPILTLAGRWEASSHILSQGLEAAKATGDHAAEALFAHQQGTLAFCRDELGAARQLLERALRLREWLADSDGAAVTRHNLQLLQPPAAASPPAPSRGVSLLPRIPLPRIPHRKELSPPPARSALQRLVADAMQATVAEGRILFNPPATMRQGVVERVEIAVAGSLDLDDALRKGLRGRGVPQFETINTSPFMAVKLTGGTGFSIERLTPTEEQLVAPTARWEFDVVPVRAGEQELHLSATMRIPLPGRDDERITVPVIERKIKVQVDLVYSSRRFVGKNWQWLAGTAIGLGGAIAAWIELFH